jgi:hypothetical protein
MRINRAVTGRVLPAVVVCALAVALGGVASSNGAQKPAAKPAKQPAYAAKLRTSIPTAMK